MAFVFKNIFQTFCFAKLTTNKFNESIIVSIKIMYYFIPNNRSIYHFKICRGWSKLKSSKTCMPNTFNLIDFKAFVKMYLYNIFARIFAYLNTYNSYFVVNLLNDNHILLAYLAKPHLIIIYIYRADRASPSISMKKIEQFFGDLNLILKKEIFYWFCSATMHTFELEKRGRT